MPQVKIDHGKVGITHLHPSILMRPFQLPLLSKEPHLRSSGRLYRVFRYLVQLLLNIYCYVPATSRLILKLLSWISGTSYLDVS